MFGINESIFSSPLDENETYESRLTEEEFVVYNVWLLELNDRSKKSFHSGGFITTPKFDSLESYLCYYKILMNYIRENPPFTGKFSDTPISEIRFELPPRKNTKGACS